MRYYSIWFVVIIFFAPLLFFIAISPSSSFSPPSCFLGACIQLVHSLSPPPNPLALILPLTHSSSKCTSLCCVILPCCWSVSPHSTVFFPFCVTALECTSTLCTKNPQTNDTRNARKLLYFIRKVFIHPILFHKLSPGPIAVPKTENSHPYNLHLHFQ